METPKTIKIKLELNKKYIVSRAVNIVISQQGKFVVYNSLSRPVKEINLDLLLILNVFLKPTSFEEAFSSLNSICIMSKKDLKRR